MEKQKRWQFYLILAVILLTVYNILPTLFYYANPLKKPIGEKEANKVTSEIVARVNSLEDFTLSWLRAQSKNLGFKPTSIQLLPEDPKIATVTFSSSEEALAFAKTLNRAGSLIPFAPAQLSADPRSFTEGSTTVYVQRKIGVHLTPEQSSEFFHFIPKTENGEVSPLYRTLVNDRLTQLALGFAGTSDAAQILEQMENKGGENIPSEATLRLARQIVEFERAFGDSNPITQRFYASFSLVNAPNKSGFITQLNTSIEKLSEQYSSKIQTLKDQQEKLRQEGGFLTSDQQQKLEVLESQKSILDSASLIVRRNISVFQSGELPLTQEAITQALESKDSKHQSLSLGKRNPFIERIDIDWASETLSLVLHPDVLTLRSAPLTSETQALKTEKLNQLLFNEIARVARSSKETITPSALGFKVELNQLTNSSSLLALDLEELAHVQAKTLENLVRTSWLAQSAEFSSSAFPLIAVDSEQSLQKQPKLGVLVYSPSASQQNDSGFRSGSLYVIVRGGATILQKYRELPDSKEKQLVEADFRSLAELLRQNGFIGYYGADSGLPAAFKDDFIFELDDFSSYLIAATREDFSVQGSKRYAVLEFTNVEQRLLTLNRIETRMHEDLAKWKDEYEAARVNLNSVNRYDVPAPTQSVFLNNMWLSTKKYFRGDERKILRWGLDLSGGKTVRIGLKNRNQQPITDENDLRQAVNELYQRVNRLGVSEVGIRIEGSTIVLDFPGSQSLSAADLIQASAMFFHVVNEKFTPTNPTLAEAVNTFLDEVWNEAVITNRTDPESVNEIAWVHLGGSPETPDEYHPVTAHARLLYENGLRISPPRGVSSSSAFNDTLSSVAIFRGKDFADWQGQTHPLLFVFHNYALEGSQLTDVYTGYDSSEGNILSFSVKGAYTNKEGERINPREDFYAWTSQFSEEKIAGTPKEAFSQGRGWRMAVLLNGSIISAPSLNSALRDSARISGHFSQREINQLAADLKAGSLSFTPQILSEENISPDLGKEQRIQGISAALLGLVLVIIVMCAYYRFGGLVASIAVLFNLLILWGVLQNLGAALTLPSIAGIILAVGMSVDANVLVFERIREEFASSKRLAAAVHAGYRKAFSAILDSNLTTIIAAVILLNFDSGPIKGFALTLLIGIVSSMFTSLFMTRYFFAGWVKNPEHKVLNMAKLFRQTNFNFLKHARLAILLSVLLMIAGGGLLVAKRHTIFGMDFTGGYALTVDLKETPETDYRLKAIQALEVAGASSHDFQVRELSRPNHLRIQLSTSMEQPGKPFYHLDSESDTQNALYTYQEYPQIVWLVQALENGGLQLEPTSLPQLNLHWTEMSGQLSDTMRNQALIGLGLALICILVYITFRFEFKYAISATLGLVHDILITLGLLAILHTFFGGIQIDLQVIAALMTIVGYSLNDTIIIFDRIREDMRVMKKTSFEEIINHALNATLSRTVMTSGTTLVVLLALVLFGGASIFNFSLIMTIGVGVGTLSSLFIASPLLLYFHRRELQKRREAASLN